MSHSAGEAARADVRADEAGGRTLAVVVGGGGGVGGALVAALRDRAAYDEVLALGRRGSPALDLLDEASIAAAAAAVRARGVPTLVFDATGFLHGGGMEPEKSWRELDPAHLAHAFAINAIGPALLMKHFLPLLPRERRAVFATLSARVGSIGDNRLGGWYSYRSAKAALNMLIKTAAIELGRTQPNSLLLAMHPGTVQSPLSAPFSGARQARPAAVAVAQMLRVADSLGPGASGQFYAYDGVRLPW